MLSRSPESEDIFLLSQCGDDSASALSTKHSEKLQVLAENFDPVTPDQLS